MGSHRNRSLQLRSRPKRLVYRVFLGSIFVVRGGRDRRKHKNSLQRDAKLTGLPCRATTAGLVDTQFHYDGTASQPLFRCDDTVIVANLHHPSFIDCWTCGLLLKVLFVLHARVGFANIDLNSGGHMRTIFSRSAALVALLTMPIAANAADLHVKAPPAPPPPPPFSWSGFYIGGDLGGVVANGNVTDNLFGLSASASHSGFIGGGEIGYNYQVNNVVFGIEGNFDWTSLNATGNGVAIPAVGTLQASANTNWVTTVAGRLGIAADRALFYVKGGGGWVGNSASITNLTTGASISASNTNSGWLIGGGIEWAFASNWSAKIEYDYLGLRSWTFNGALLPTDAFTVSRNLQMVKVGLNYRFDWNNPVVARY